MSKPNELYDVLGLKPDASDADIKKAFKKMARIYHPDRNKDPGAEEMIKKINQAKEILTDPEKKKTYDRFGMAGFEQQAGGDPFDIFNAFRHNPHQRKKMQTQYEISMKDYFTKTSVVIDVQRNIKCEACEATGFTDKKQHMCTRCNGAGMVINEVRHGNGMMQTRTICPVCQGQRIDVTAIKLKCGKCGAQGTVMSNEKIEVTVPRDIIANGSVTLENKGSWHENTYVDLEIIFRLINTKEFTITSNGKLIHTMNINYTETMCGFRRILGHPSGKDILIVCDKGQIINPDHIYFLDRLGFNNDVMYLSFIIKYPESITLPKKKMLTFETLETALGARAVPNVLTDMVIDPENVYMLSSLKKINNNAKANQDEISDDSFDQPEFAQPGFHPGMGQSVQCAQQ